MLLAAAVDTASAARPATRPESRSLQRSAGAWLPMGAPDLSSKNVVTQACVSTVEPGFAVAIVVNPRMSPHRMLMLGPGAGDGAPQRTVTTCDTVRVAPRSSLTVSRTV